MKISVTPPAACPTCQRLTDWPHQVGNVILCLECGAVNRYAPDLSLVPIDESELPPDVRAEVASLRGALACTKWGASA